MSHASTASWAINLFPSGATSTLAAALAWAEHLPGAIIFTIFIVVFAIIFLCTLAWLGRREVVASTKSNRRALLAQARDFVITTISQDQGYAYFQRALEASEIYLKLRPYLKADFHRALTSGRVVIAAPLASNMPGIAWAFIHEIERLEKDWKLI